LYRAMCKATELIHEQHVDREFIFLEPCARRRSL
jgi:hypothetical protein